VTTIKLEEVNQDNWRAALQLTVRPDQQRFVADAVPVAAIGLAKAYIRPGGMVWLPYAVVADDDMVGFLMLAFPPCWMYHFFIDQRYQGRGYGSLALAAFIEMVRREHPTCKHIQLTVHPENLAAQRLYTRAGFVATGDILYGEPVYRLALH